MVWVEVVNDRSMVLGGRCQPISRGSICQSSITNEHNVFFATHERFSGRGNDSGTVGRSGFIQARQQRRLFSLVRKFAGGILAQIGSVRRAENQRTWTDPGVSDLPLQKTDPVSRHGDDWIKGRKTGHLKRDVEPRNIQSIQRRGVGNRKIGDRDVRLFFAATGTDHR